MPLTEEGYLRIQVSCHFAPARLLERTCVGTKATRENFPCLLVLRQRGVLNDDNLIRSQFDTQECDECGIFAVMSEFPHDERR
jgi:hypothetical protein